MLLVSAKRIHPRARSGEADSATGSGRSQSLGRVAAVNARPRLRDGRRRPRLTTAATGVAVGVEGLVDILRDSELRFVARLLLTAAPDTSAAPLDVAFQAALRRRLMLKAQLQVLGMNDSQDL